MHCPQVCVHRTEVPYHTALVPRLCKAHNVPQAPCHNTARGYRKLHAIAAAHVTQDGTPLIAHCHRDHGLQMYCSRHPCPSHWHHATPTLPHSHSNAAPSQLVRPWFDDRSEPHSAMHARTHTRTRHHTPTQRIYRICRTQHTTEHRPHTHLREANAGPASSFPATVTAYALCRRRCHCCIYCLCVRVA